MATKSKVTNKDTKAITSVIAREDDGGLQVTLSIPVSIIEIHEKDALHELSHSMDISGFRKGRAPVSEVKKRVSPDKLNEKILVRILPHAFADAIATHKLKPAMYPRFTLIDTDESVWQVRAETCEIPNFDLPEYKEMVKKAFGEKDSTEDKQAKAIKALIEGTTITIPKILINEEVTVRLSQLLSRIEKLGLTLDGYLSSIGKTSETLRHEYEHQTKDAIALELILNKIAEVEKIEVSQKEIDDALGVSANMTNNNLSENEKQEQRRNIASILKRRAVLDSLISNA